MTDAVQALPDTRVSYADTPFLEADLAATPLEQFRRWYADAVSAQADGRLVEPNAMTLATAGPGGQPVARTVLLKGVDGEGLRFFTNLTSRKGRALSVRPRVGLLFAWLPLHRQVGVIGTAVELPRDEVAEYFASRPYGSRIGAVASRQSQVAGSRDEIDAAAAALAARHPDTGSASDVPLPHTWGGFVVRVSEMEFWQGRPSRLHDRLAYVAPDLSDIDDPAAWRVERRWP